jgi:hypothetical protein
MTWTLFWLGLLLLVIFIGWAMWMALAKGGE